MSDIDYIQDGYLIETHKIESKVFFKNIRKEYGMTQKEISELLNIPLTTWRQWEQGRREPPEYIEKLVVYSLKFLNQKNKDTNK